MESTKGIGRGISAWKLKGAICETCGVKATLIISTSYEDYEFACKKCVKAMSKE